VVHLGSGLLEGTPKLTVNLGLRADHEGQWYDKLGGAQVWDPASYVNTANPPANTGLVWNGKGNPSKRSCPASPAGEAAVPLQSTRWRSLMTSSVQARRLCAADSEPTAIRSPTTMRATP
jgi:hypothetical protein